MGANFTRFYMEGQFSNDKFQSEVREKERERYGAKAPAEAERQGENIRRGMPEEGSNLAAAHLEKNPQERAKPIGEQEWKEKGLDRNGLEFKEGMTEVEAEMRAKRYDETMLNLQRLARADLNSPLDKKLVEAAGKLGLYADYDGATVVSIKAAVEVAKKLTKGMPPLVGSMAGAAIEAAGDKAVEKIDMKGKEERRDQRQKGWMSGK